jgi:hypothetical protein
MPLNKLCAGLRWPPDVTQKFAQALLLVRRMLVGCKPVKSDFWQPWNLLPPEHQFLLVGRAEAIWVRAKSIEGGITAWDEGAARAIWHCAIEEGLASERNGQTVDGLPWAADLERLIDEHLPADLKRCLVPSCASTKAQVLLENTFQNKIGLFVESLFEDADYDFLELRPSGAMSGSIVMGPPQRIADKLGIPGSYFRCPLPGGNGEVHSLEAS